MDRNRGEPSAAWQPESAIGNDGRTSAHTRLHEFFESTSAASPDLVAVDVGGRGITYSELDARANGMALFLQELGVRPGERCGIRLSRGLDLYVAMLAVLKAGAAFVPLDPTCPDQRLRYILRDSDVSVLLTASSLRPTPVEECRLVDIDRQVFSRVSEPLPPPLCQDTDTVCYVMYTSGYTGRPKGVEITHRNMCNFLAVVPHLYGIRPDDRVYQGMTLAFDFALEEIWTAWCVGATVVAGPVDAGAVGPDLAEFVSERNITTLCAVPTVLATLDHELPSVRTLIVGGEACPDELVARWVRPGRRILNTYGPTETTITATCADVSEGGRVSIGTAIPTYSVMVLDRDLQPVPSGQVGEICIGGPGVAKGYVRSPDLTAERFVESPLPGGGRLYRTGDIGRSLPGGELQFVGRSDSQVQVRGHRVELQEIESVLLEDPSVQGAAAAVTRAESGEPRLVAFVTLRGSRCDDDDLRSRLQERLRARLSPYMLPEFLDVLPSLPTLPNGKVDRASLPRPQRRLTRAQTSYTRPTSPTEVRMTAVWAKVLGMPMNQVSASADFFLDLGGHSWLAAAAISALRRSGVASTLSLTDLYAFPTVRDLARRQDDLSRASLSSVPAQRTHDEVQGLPT